MVIYKVKNEINGKIYIGKTVQDFDKYKNKHIQNAKNNVDLKYGKPKALYESIRKYGHENFSWEILHVCENKQELNEKEIFYINLYESYLHGYNMTKGGDGGNGGNYERTKEIKERISLSLLGHKRSKESIEKQKQNMSGEKHPLFGIGHNKTSIEKMKKSKLGDKNPNYKKYKITDPQGNEYIINGGFGKFCLKNHIWRDGLKAVYKKEKPDHKGWKCEILYDSKNKIKD